MKSLKSRRGAIRCLHVCFTILQSVAFRRASCRDSEWSVSARICGPCSLQRISARYIRIRCHARLFAGNGSSRGVNKISAW